MKALLLLLLLFFEIKSKNVVNVKKIKEINIRVPKKITDHVDDIALKSMK